MDNDDAKCLSAHRRRRHDALLHLEGELSTSREALRASEARFRSVVEGSPQGVVVQQDARIVYANPTMAELFGYDNADVMVGLSPFDDLIDGDLTQFRKRTEEAYRGARLSATPPWRARHRSGKLRWISSTAHASEWDGRPAVTSFYTDVTAQRNTEIALRESEARYRAALETARIGAWETDLVAATRQWTAEGMHLFELSLPDRRGQVAGAADELLARMHPDDRNLLASYHALADTVDVFPAEYRILKRDGSTAWLSGRGQVIARTPEGRAHRLINVMLDISERKRAEETQRLLVAELDHRVKNTLAVVQSVARQTLRRTDDPAEFVPSFMGRIQSLARIHSLLSKTTWQSAELGELVRHEVLQGPVDETRVTAIGPTVLLQSQSAMHLAMMLHELATNASKYGALSNDKGELTVSWKVEEAVLHLRWEERGGPPVPAALGRGFGTTLIERSAAAESGEARMSKSASGISWDVSIRLPDRTTGGSSDPPAGGLAQRATQATSVAGVEAGVGELTGKRFLLVEDEPLIAMELAAWLEDAGVQLVASAATVQEALASISDRVVDAALVDGNLHGQPVDEVAAALTERNIPFAFVTGYGRDSLPPAHADAPLLDKPVSPQRLFAVASALVGAVAQRS